MWAHILGGCGLGEKKAEVQKAPLVVMMADFQLSGVLERRLEGQEVYEASGTPGWASCLKDPF